MDNKTLSKFRKGKGIKTVTGLPNFLLKLKGKSDAKKGLATVETYIEKMKSHCQAIESNEVLSAESILFSSRKEGAALLASIHRNYDILQKIPQARNEESVSDIRANRRNENKVLSATTSIKESYEKITSVNELIIDINACLQQRIMKTRNLCSAKINTYLSGVCEVVTDFKTNSSYDDTATSNYIEKHRLCDQAIRAAAESVLEQGEGNESI